MKRAWCPGGGGPNLGLHLGFMEFLTERGLMDSFKVISAACIGAWVAVVYWSKDGTDVERLSHTYKWFKPVFQPDDVHRSFPINRVFATDTRGQTKAYWKYFTDPQTIRDAWVPAEMFRVGMNTLKHMMRPQLWLDESTFNLLLLEWYGAHPASRILTGMQFRTIQTGQSRIFWPDAPLLREIKVNRLYQSDRPEIRFNAINLTAESGPQMELFTNRPARLPSYDHYGLVDVQTLCACSALPYIFSPIEVDGNMYCEGATVDTVNLLRLLEDHPDLDEVWISRIVGLNQAQAPSDLTGALANSYMIPASSMGEASIAAFRAKARELNWKGRIIEVPVPKLKWEWSEANLKLGMQLGREAIEGEWKIYEKGDRV